MLEIQKLLAQPDGLRSIKEDLGIKVTEHPHLPLVNFSYDQIDSPKYHPVVREARGLVLEKDTWKVVAKAFDRFYNLGEDQEVLREDSQVSFDWYNFTTTVKEDGSLILLYYYDGDWQVSTRGSFALGEMGFSGKSWREVFWEVWNDTLAGQLPINEKYKSLDKLSSDCTYVFEFWTPFNEVVRTYAKSCLFLLSVFDHSGQVSRNGVHEYTDEQVDKLAISIGAQRPERFAFKDEAEIRAFLKEKEVSDKTFEGFVLRDKNNIRIKVKSETYLAIHHLLDNNNLFNPSRQVPLVLQGETSEVLAVLKDKIERCPALKERIEKTKSEVEAAWQCVLFVWRLLQGIEVQKDFALKLMKPTPLTPFHGLLFANRKAKGDEKTLRATWLDSADLIVKVLYGAN